MALKDILKTLNSEGLFVPRFERFVLSKLKEEQKRRSEAKAPEGFRASAADFCPRDMTYAFMGVPEDGDDETVQGFFRLAIGNLVHELLQGLTSEMIKKGFYGIEEAYPPEHEFVNTRLKITGHTDYPVIIDGEEIVLEFKTANERSYSEIIAKNKPIESHVYQAQGYMLLTGFRKVLVIYWNKNDHRMKEFIVEYNEEIIKSIIDGIKLVKKSLKDKVLPVRMCKNMYEGGYCKRKSICFSKKTFDDIEKMLREVE